MRALIFVFLLAACSDKPPPMRPTLTPITAPRAATAGEPLLARLPAGADVVAEVDMIRLRANPVLGPLLVALAGHGDPARLGFDVFRDVDVVVAAVYHLGSDQAGTLFLLTGTNLSSSSIPEAETLTGAVLAIGPEALRESARLATKTVSGDALFMHLRDTAMPAKAEGASLRLTANLSKNARIAAAGRLAVDEFPATISLWMDVADDAALIALIGADDAAEAKRLVVAVEDARDHGGRYVPAWLGGGRLLSVLTAETTGKTAKLTWILGPRRFSEWAKQARGKLAAPPPTTQPAKGTAT